MKKTLTMLAALAISTTLQAQDQSVTQKIRQHIINKDTFSSIVDTNKIVHTSVYYPIDTYYESHDAHILQGSEKYIVTVFSDIPSMSLQIQKRIGNQHTYFIDREGDGIVDLIRTSEQHQWEVIDSQNAHQTLFRQALREINELYNSSKK